MANLDKDQVTLMSINATKAGMEGLDKAAINAIIEEASKGSKFYEAKKASQKRIDAKKENMRQKLKSLGQDAIRKAETKADKLIEELLMTESDSSQVIVHVDMDAFYAAVEEKDDPSLKTCPMAVGGMGMLSTSNYLARKFGVRAGMPGFIGKKLCPQLKIVPTNFSKYRAVSSQVRQVFSEYDKNFCPMSLDEAYLNLTDYLLSHPSLKPAEVVDEMRAKIQEKTTLTASAGISLNCLVAKICSDLNKPNGQYELLIEDEMREFVSQLPIRKVGGIGNVTEQLLEVIGVKTCQDILDKRGSILLLFTEQTAAGFFRVALGIGCTDVAGMSNGQRKSMSTETTFKDTSDPEKLREICNELCLTLASDLQSENLKGTQVTLKITTDKPNDQQRSIKNFMTGNSVLLESFECPLCGVVVEARNEAAFNMTHFEKCYSAKFEEPSSKHSKCVAGNSNGGKSNDDDDEGRSRGGVVDDGMLSSCKTRDSESIEIGQFPSSSSSESNLHAGKFESKKVIDPPPRGAGCNVENSNDINVTLTCPICQCKLEEESSDSYDAINTHIDLCLNKQTIGQIVSSEGQSCSDKATNTKKRKLIPSVIVNSKKPCNKKEASIKSYFTPMT